MIVKRISTYLHRLSCACLVLLVANCGLMAGDEDILTQKGNWSYKMNSWEWEQPVENQKRWDRETQGWWFNFGPTGVRVAFDVNAPREAVVMYVFPDSPADKKILKGDRIIGVNGRTFTTKEPFPPSRGRRGSSFAISGPRLEVAKAIEESEGDPKRNGILSFMVKRDGKTLKADLQLERLGYFSKTFPYNCTKSRRLAEWAGDWLIENRRNGHYMNWGPPRMGDWVDLPAQLALLSFGNTYKKHFSPGANGGVMWSWIAGIRLITVAEKQQRLGGKKFLKELEEMSRSYATKSGPSGAYSHKTWYKGAPFQLAFAAGLNSLGQSLALKCGAEIDEASYLRTRYLLTCKTNDKGNIGYGAAHPTPFSVDDARKAVGNIKPSIIKTDEEVTWRLVGGAACTTLTHFVDPRDSFSEDFVKRGVRHAMAARWTSRQSHGCGSLTFVFNTLAASIAPVVGEEKMYRKYMDDMKWWLIMARCHNGGWYFEPKIDTEANPYGRIHMTAAAILMLNAPLRELYVNGKGHESTTKTTSRSPAWASSNASPTSTDEPTGAVGDTWEPMRPTRRSRRLASGKADDLNKALQQTLKYLLKKGSLQGDTMVISRLPTEVKLVGVDGENWLRFQILGSKVTRPYSLDSLSKQDRAAISVAVANSLPKSTDAQALAGAFCEMAGHTADADAFFKKAGTASRKKFEKLFR